MVYPILGLDPAQKQGLSESWRQLFTTPLQQEQTSMARFSYAAVMKGSFVVPGAAILVAALAATVAGQQTKDAAPQSPVDTIHKLGLAGPFCDMLGKAASLR